MRTFQLAPLSVSILALTTGSAALAAPKPAALPVPPVVEGRLVLGAAEGSADQHASFAFLDGFPAEPAIVYLDLKVAPAVVDAAADQPDIDFMSTAYGPNGQPMPEVPCVLGASQMIDRDLARLSLGTGAIHPHVVLTLEVLPAADAPFNAISCDYAPSEAGQVVIHVRGSFIVQETAIPTARDIRLVPYRPPHEVAVQVLATRTAAP